MSWHGILNLNKPAGWTSHDVVARVRRILGQRDVGHAGTLDPMATGVLAVCAGQATRVAEYLMAHDKVYRAGIRLGVTTDTYDLEGTPTANADVPALARADLDQALRAFVGSIEQVPPAYSAIKQDGVPLHRLARQGIEVKLTPRPVAIYRIDVLDWQSPDLIVEVECGPGTYIRSLAHDLGQVLGCGAALSSLVRLRSGRLRIEDAVTLEALAGAAAEGRLAEHMRPLVDALGDLIELPVDAAATLRLRQGQAIDGPSASGGAVGYASDRAGGVIAIVYYDPDQQAWQPRKVFAQ